MFGLSTPGLSTQVFSVLPALSMCPGGIGSWFQAYVVQLLRAKVLDLKQSEKLEAPQVALAPVGRRI